MTFGPRSLRQSTVAERGRDESLNLPISQKIGIQDTWLSVQLRSASSRDRFLFDRTAAAISDYDAREGDALHAA
jgi:hypothetical protein